MTPFYTGVSEERPERPLSLPASERWQWTKPERYRPDPGLVDAVNVALLLNQPLLLTGEPGTGKTQLAHSVAFELGYPKPLIFETKSTSKASDLFYTYDTIGRFHAAQTKEGSQSSIEYIRYNALGRALLNANDRAEVKDFLPPDYQHPGSGQRSVVLIDEIDKAPRDFPNDILSEIEGMYFRVPELKNIRIAANQAMAPVLILTSNSEKHLPDAFLRRCIYYNIPFPDLSRLNTIVKGRMEYLNDGRMLSDALELFSKLREPASALVKRPATAELLGWLSTLVKKGVDPGQSLVSAESEVRSSLCTLIKNAEDQDAATAVLNAWISQKKTT